MEMALMRMIHKETLDSTLIKSFDQMSHLYEFIGAILEEVDGITALAQDPADPTSNTTERKIEDGVRKRNKKLFDPLPPKKESSSKASSNSSMALGGLHHPNKKETLKMPLVARAGNWRMRSALPYMQPCRTTRLSTLRPKKTQSPNRPIVSMNEGIVPKVMIMSLKSLTRRTIASDELSTTEHID